MKIKNLIIAAGFIALCCSCTKEAPQLEVSPEASVSTADGPGTAYLYLSEEKAAQAERGEFNLTGSGLGVLSMDRIIPDGGRFDKRHRQAGLHRWYKVEYSTLVPQTKASRALNEMSGIESVSFPHKIVTNSAFNDPYFGLQWNLHNDGSLSSSLGSGQYAAGCDINVLPVWENYTAGSSSVIVAVIDGGVDASSPDLSGVVLPVDEHGSMCLVNGYEKGPLHPDSHGTHVASIIGAMGNNASGIAGVAGGKDGNGGVRIMALEWYMPDPLYPGSSRYASEDNLLYAFVHAADEGAVIINNSWNFLNTSEADAAESAREFLNEPSPVKSGIDYFVENAGYDESGQQTGPMAGGLVVFSAGNEEISCGVPGVYDKVLAVGAHGRNYDFSEYSNYGYWVDLVAPGGNCYSGETSDPRGWIPGLDAGGAMACLKGTSQAAPHVSGVAALLVSYFGGPGFTNEMLWDYLLGGAKRGVLTGKMSGPMLDAAGSFDFALNNADKVSIIAPCEDTLVLKGAETIHLDFRIMNNDEIQYPITLETDCPGVSFAWDTTLNKTNFHLVEVIAEGPKAEPGEYEFEVFVGKGTSKEVSKKIVFTVLENHTPEIVGTLDNIIFTVDDIGNELAEYMMSVKSKYSDPDGDPLQFTCTADFPEVYQMDESDGIYMFIPMERGLANVTITATDACGASASQSFVIVVIDPTHEYEAYPNPVHDYFYVRTNATVDVSVDIINGNGKVILSVSGSSCSTKPLAVNMYDLAPGQYLAQITVNGKRVRDMVIVKI